MKFFQKMMATVFLTLFFGSSSGAEIFYGNNDKASGFIRIIGTIETGDYLRVKELIDGMLPRDKSVEPPTIRISVYSSGGDLVEAMKIGALAHELFIPVRAPTASSCGDVQRGYGVGIGSREEWPDNVDKADACACYSACFVIWSGGMHRYGGKNEVGFIGRAKGLLGNETFIGVHRPRFGASYFSNLTAREAEKKYSSMSDELVSYLVSMEVPETIIEIMLRTPSSDMHILSEKEYQSIGSWPTAIDEWLESKCIETRLTSQEQRDRKELFLSKYGERGLSGPEQRYLRQLDVKRAEYGGCRARAADTERAARIAELY